jgi:hypothetical protein
MERLAIIHNSYTTHLVNIMTPYIYQGIETLYRKAAGVHEQLKLVEKAEKIAKKERDGTSSTDASGKKAKKAPSKLKVFQNLLRLTSTWSREIIDKETDRIRNESGTSKYFDNLVRAVILSNIRLLSNGRGVGSQQDYHKRINIPNFVHKCYLESCKSIYNNPRLFWDEGVDSIHVIENRNRAYANINRAVGEAISRMLPMNEIITSYLQEDPASYEVDQALFHVPAMQSAPVPIQMVAAAPQTQVMQAGGGQQPFAQPITQLTTQPTIQQPPQQILQQAQVQATPVVEQQPQIDANVTAMANVITAAAQAQQSGATVDQVEIQQVTNVGANGAKAPRNTLSFVVSMGKSTVAEVMAPTSPRDKHEIMEMMKVDEEPSEAVGKGSEEGDDNISFSATAGNTRKLNDVYAASGRSSGSRSGKQRYVPV